MEDCSIQKLVKDTQVYLDGVWDELGTGSADREAATKALFADLQTVLQQARDKVDADREEAEAQRSKETEEITTMATCMDVDADMPEQGSKGILQHVDALRSRASELASLKSDRQEQLKALCEEASSLFADVGAAAEEEFAAVGSKLTTSRVHAFENRIAELKADKEERRGRIDPMCEEIRSIWEIISHEADSELETQIAEGADATGFSDESISNVAAALESWRADKCSREETIREVGEQITELWEKLGTPDEEQTAFLQSDNSISDSVIASCKRYLAEKQEEFQNRLHELVGDLREKMTALWEEIEAGVEEKEAFKAFQAEGDGVDEACWEAHKEQLATLEAKAAKMRPILTIHGKRQAILADRDEYERIISDPTRLTSRRGGAARLREEKLERRIKRDLPRATAKLRAMTEAWEKETGAEFCVGGQRLLDSLDEEQAEEEARKEAKRAARKGGKARDSVASSRPSSARGRSLSRSSTSSASRGGGRKASSSASTSSSSSSKAAGGEGGSGAQAAAGKRKPLARSTGAANIQTKPATKRTHAGSGIPRTSRGGTAGCSASTEPITPSAVKVAGEAKAAAAAMATALKADE